MDESLSKYKHFIETRDNKSLKFAVCLAADSFSHLLLFILKEYDLQYKKENGYTKDFSECLGILENSEYKSEIKHKGAVKKLKYLRNKFTHQEIQLNVDDVANDMDLFCYSIISFCKDWDITLQDIINESCKQLLLERSKFYLDIIKEKAVFIDPFDLDEIGMHIGDCPDCGGEDAFGLIDDDTYYCALCEETHKAGRCDECGKKFPDTEFRSLISPNTCEDCYDYYTDKFR